MKLMAATKTVQKIRQHPKQKEDNEILTSEGFSKNLFKERTSKYENDKTPKRVYNVSFQEAN